MSGRDEFQPEAEGIPFDPTGSSLVSEEVGPALRELQNNANTSASPGFSFGKGGNVAANAYLLNESVPSNISGRYVYINNAIITRVFIAVQNAATFDVAVYHHDGNETNLTLVGTVSVVSSTGGEFTVSWPIPTQKQLAMRIVNGSAKNAVGGLELSGST